MPVEALGWLGSAILVITLSYQVYQQWRRGDSTGVSPWLFVGQLGTASAFIAYAGLIGNAVFVVTNTIIAVTAILGLVICHQHRVRGGARDQGKSPATEPRSS
ncbi:MAG: hypothetical protein CMJ31_14585 [Phycisphaerae bacterium]|nr:hypothetical protein [Phycisphaerae bacterium]